MSVLQAVPRVLDALERGEIVRPAIAIALRILAVGLLVGCVVFVVEILKLSFRLDTEGTLGGVLLALFLTASFVVMAQALWHRAGGIALLENSTFTVLPIASLLFRTAGELVATLLTALGVGGCLFAWLSGIAPASVLGDLADWLPESGGEGRVLGGLLLLAWSVAAALGAIIFAYLLAELTLVLADMAKNLRLLVRRDVTARVS